MNAKPKYTFLLLLFVTLFACQRAKEKGEDILDGAQSKLRKEVNDWLNEGLSFRKTDFTSEFGEQTVGLKVVSLGGLWCEMPLGFYSGFLKYSADTHATLMYIAKIPTEKPNISDTAFYEVRISKIVEGIDQVKQIHGHDFQDAIQFFETFSVDDSTKVYQCNRYPNTHYLIFNQEADTIYHYFEKYWD